MLLPFGTFIHSYRGIRTYLQFGFFELIIVSKHDFSLYLNWGSWVCTCVAIGVEFFFSILRQVPSHNKEIANIVLSLTTQM